MTSAARADARGDRLPLTDRQAQVSALVLQIGLAAWAVRDVARGGAGRHEVARTGLSYAAAIATVTFGVAVGRHVPVWFIVPIVGVVAARFAMLPLPSGNAPDALVTEHASPVATTLLFTWTVAVLVLQGQLLTGIVDLAATVVAFGSGIVLSPIGSLHCERSDCGRSGPLSAPSSR